MNIFVNEKYAELEEMVKAYSGDKEELDVILRKIRGASLFGEISSHEEIRLMDLLMLPEADDIDEGVVVPYSEKGGIQYAPQKEVPDMSYLDDFEEEEEEQESGFLGLLR